MTAEKNQQVPTDIKGIPLPNLTPEQRERKKELEVERLEKSAQKGIYRLWSREEVQMLISWAHHNNYNTTLSEFRHIVEAFIEHARVRQPIVIRSWEKVDKSGREVDVWCTHCGRVHTYDVPVLFRGEFTVPAKCTMKYKPESGNTTFDDQTPIAKWEHTWLREDKEL